jgi:glutathione S-transferase fosA
MDMEEPPKLLSRIQVIVLGVTDLKRSVSFYHETLGLEVAGQSGGLAFLDVNGLTLMLNTALAGRSTPVAGATEVVFAVESVSAGHRLLEDVGCHFIRTPREVTPGSWAATFLDPDGHKLTLLGPE